MITQPTTARLLDVVRKELAENIAPVATTPQAQASVQMIDHILATIAVRAGHEIAWMVEEIDALESLGADIVTAGHEAPRVADALGALRSTDAMSLHYDDVAARYSLAAEILSCASEEVAAESPLRPAVEEQLDQRLAHEVEIMGEFELVGRT